MEKSKIKIQGLEKYAKDTIFKSLAMMAYNPSIGRVFRKGGVNEFISAANEMFLNIEDIQTRDDFDLWHDNFVNKIKNTIRETSTGKPVSYGQAQKPINVFLKVYVDWARLPSAEVTVRLRPYLHVPLDSKVMKYTKNAFFPHYQKYKLRVTSLSKIIDKESYYSWQNCFRELAPKKPLIIDVAWALSRFNK